MADLIQQTTIDDLPDEMLAKIFNCLKFYGNLRCSLVCGRWFTVVQNDIGFMRTLKFKVIKQVFPETDLHKITTLTRTYRSVIFQDCFNFWEPTELKISLLKNAEYIEFYACKFKDFCEFKTVVDYCKNVKEFRLAHTEFSDLTLVNVTSQSQQMEVMARPVRCFLYQTCWRALNYIENISQLEVHNGLISGFGMTEFLQQYAPMLITLFQYDSSTRNVLPLLVPSQNLKLQSFGLLFGRSSNLPALDFFLSEQQNYLTSLTIVRYALFPELLDVVCKYLKNLEIFECKLSVAESINLNALRTLKKLRTLVLNLREFDELCHLDISELSLTELFINANDPHHDQDLKLFDNTSTKVMTSIKELRILDAVLHHVAFHQMISLMPNLEFLSIFYFECDRSNILCDDAFKLNKLIHLRTLILGHAQFNNFFLCTLKLPELQRLIVVGYELNELNRVALNFLAKNCPKLLTIEHQQFIFNRFYGTPLLMVAKRTKYSESFRFVKSQSQMECLDVFDEESLASCSESDEDVADVEWDF